MKKDDLIMFAIVAGAAAVGVFAYGWIVNRYGGQFPVLADSAAAFNSPLTF